MKKRWMLVLLFLLWTRCALAATYYVDASKTGVGCNDARSTSSALPRIARGVACLVNPGDILEIAAGTYDETVAWWPASGASGNPIIVRNRAGDTVVWTRTGMLGENAIGFITSIDQNYISLRGITFSNANGRIPISITKKGLTGVEITGCIFINNGNRGLFDGESEGSIIINLRDILGFKVTNNTFDRNYGWMIGSNNSANGLIQGNTCTNQRSTQRSFGANQFEAVFVHNNGGSANNTIDSNVVHDFNQDSYVTTNYAASGVKMDTSGGSSIVTNNTFYNLGYEEGSTNGSVNGISIESGCNNNIAKNNIIYNVAGRGIVLGSRITNTNSGNTIDGNTIYNCRCAGVALNNVSSATIRNNIVHMTAATASAIVGTTQASGVLYRNNLYYNSASTNIGSWNWDLTAGPCPSPNLSLSSWATPSGEINSSSSNPQFRSLATPDFHLQQGSPGIGAGIGGIDMGAYPAISPLSIPTGLRVVE